jgi:hypothetical protein
VKQLSKKSFEEARMDPPNHTDDVWAWFSMTFTFISFMVTSEVSWSNSALALDEASPLDDET